MPKAEKNTKKEKQIHPNSRKASQLAKILHKEDKKQKKKSEQNTRLSSLCEKLLWFQSQLDEEKAKYSINDISELISKYINRFDIRLKEIKELEKFHKEQGRHGRAHAAEEDGIKTVYEREHSLFVTGQFEAPDVTNRKNLKIFREWDGQLAGIPAIKLKMFKKAPISVDVAMETTAMQQ